MQSGGKCHCAVKIFKCIQIFRSIRVVAGAGDSRPSGDSEVLSSFLWFGPYLKCPRNVITVWQEETKENNLKTPRGNGRRGKSLGPFRELQTADV